MNIRVRVTELKLETETDYDSPGMPKRDVTKVHISQDVNVSQNGVKNAFLFATVPAGAPNPFVLGQRLVLLVIPEPTVLQFEQAPPAVDETNTSPVQEPMRDEALGLGVADRAAQDLIPAAAR